MMIAFHSVQKYKFISKGKVVMAWKYDLREKAHYKLATTLTTLIK